MNTVKRNAFNRWNKMALVILSVMVLLGGCKKSAPPGETVNMFMWGGDQNVNRYIDEFVAPNLKEKHNITLVRTPMDISQVLEKLSSEKQASKNTGTIDVIWINGENFKIAKEQRLLWGDIEKELLNSREFIDEELKSNDAGVDVNGMEVPWGKVKFAFQYNSEYVKTPPTNFDELKLFCIDNPGKFTYPQADDFTGNGFIKTLIRNISASEPPSDAEIERAYDYLREIKPYLWKRGETYPNTLEALDKLFADGEVYLTMGYNENRAAPYAEQGFFPETTKTLTFSDYTIYNCHFLSVPFNAPNLQGALTTINYLVSGEAQLEKEKTSVWGDSTVLNLDKLPDEYKEEFLEVRANNPYPVESFGGDIPDMDADTSLKIRETWIKAIFEQ